MTNDDDDDDFENDGECEYHKPLHIDCDRFTALWNAIESIREDYIAWNADESELKMLDDMQKELEAGIVEKKNDVK